MMEAAQERVPEQVRTEAGRALHWTRSRIVQATQYLQGNGRTELRLQLNPPELGRLRLEVEMREGTLEVRIRVEDAQVREVIRSEMQSLDRALKDMDVDVSRFDVSDYRQGSDRGGWGSREGLPGGSGFGGEGLELGELEEIEEAGWVRITESGGMDCLV
jgi:flagellar hook-length control protein FliK